MKRSKRKILNLLLVFLSFISMYSKADGQIITTVAGGVTGHGGYWGDGGPATAAELNLFAAFAIDTNNNIYIADGFRIRKVDAATSIIHTIAGTGVAGYNGDGIPATTAQLNGPGCVSLDNSGNLYIYDYNNNRIRKIDAMTGIISTYAGNGTFGSTGDGGPATAATIDGGDMAWDAAGNLYYASNRRIRKITPSGIISNFVGNGLPGVTGDGVPATATFLAPMRGLAFDASGNLFGADSTSAVRKIATTGIITKIAGTGDNIASPYSGDGIAATTCHIYPFDISVDNVGNLFISDFANSRVERVDGSGIIYTIAGTGVAGFSGDGGPATAAMISHPENVVLDKCGNVYICDFNNKRVRKVTYTPVPITLTNTLAASPSETICIGTSVTFTAAAAASSGAITYQWYRNGVLISAATSNSYTYTPANGDSVKCIATAANSCGATNTVGSNTAHMVVNPIAMPAIIVAAPASVAIGSLVTVSATITPVAVSAGSYTMHWYKNSILFSTTTTPSITYIKGAGTDHITATVIPVGCYDSASSVVANITGVPAGVNNVAVSQVYIYPNPAHDMLNIEATGTPMQGYTVSNIIGSTLQYGTLKQGTNRISLQALPAGIYIVTVTAGEGEKIIRKIIKQ